MPSSLQMERMPIFPNLLGIQVTPQPLVIAVMAVIAVTAAIATAGPTRSSWTPLKRDSSDSWNRLIFVAHILNQMWTVLPLARHVSTCINMYQHVSTCINMCQHVSTCINKYCTGTVGGQFCSSDSQRNIGLKCIQVCALKLHDYVCLLWFVSSFPVYYCLLTKSHKATSIRMHLVLSQG